MARQHRPGNQAGALFCAEANRISGLSRSRALQFPLHAYARGSFFSPARIGLNPFLSHDLTAIQPRILYAFYASMHGSRAGCPRFSEKALTGGAFACATTTGRGHLTIRTFQPNCQGTSRLSCASGSVLQFVIRTANLHLRTSINQILQLLYHLYTIRRALPNKSRPDLTCWATGISAQQVKLAANQSPHSVRAPGSRSSTFVV